MTRATVGGINSEDNLWYPLAVNSQGIAQIDTSGIPQPMQWEESSFQPFFSSSESGEDFGIIQYARQVGLIYRLGNMVWWKVLLIVSDLVITDPRGRLFISGLPYTWAGSSDWRQGTRAGGSIDRSTNFNPGILVREVLQSGGGANNLELYKYDTNTQTEYYLMVTDLLEGEDMSSGNMLWISGFGLITSTDSPTREQMFEHLRLTATEADTP